MQVRRQTCNTCIDYQASLLSFLCGHVSFVCVLWLVGVLCRDVSPGLAAVVTIRFVPHSLDEYEDHLTLLQETGPLLIPLYARRERPCLVLSEGGGAVGEAGLDVGMTLIGDAKHTTYDHYHTTHHTPHRREKGGDVC